MGITATSRSLRVTLVIGLGAAGLLLVIFLIRWEAMATGHPGKPDSLPTRAAAPSLPQTSPEGTPPSQLSPAQPPSEAPKAASKDRYLKLQNAKAIYEAWAKAEKGGQTEEAMNLLARLSELDEESSTYFIDRYRDSDEEDPDELALTFALACGGKEVAELLRKHVSAGSPVSEKREQILSALCSFNGYPFSMKKIPLDDGLLASAALLTQSKNAVERAAGASLLQTSSDIGLRTRLYELAETDVDLFVRYEAIRSLGLMGDRETLAYLERYASSHPAILKKGDQELGGRLRKVLQAAVDELRDRMR